MNEMIKEQSIFALELKTPYSPVIHNPKAIANYMYLDGNLCSAPYEDELKSALMILSKMELGVN